MFCVLCSTFFLWGLVVTPAHVRITTKVTWAREIGPIVQARCVSCHSPGGRAPMSLATYEDARPWAKAIKEEVLSRRMPKWAGVRGYGDFTNDPSLSAFEIALVTAWADGGAPARAGDAGQTPGTQPPRVPPPPRTRPVEVPCGAQRLPPGRLLGLKPNLAEGDSVRLTVVYPDGGMEPLLWVRGFDPDFADTYWLRNPVTLTPRVRLRAESASAPCTITALLAARTGK